MVFCKDCYERYEQCQNKSRIEIKSLKKTILDCSMHLSFALMAYKKLQVVGFITITVFFAHL